MSDQRGATSESPGPEAAVYVISVAAQLTGLHPQTLRTYERMGLVSPGRTGGGGRRYSARDVEQLRSIARLSAAGIGLEGVRRILDLQNQVTALHQLNAELRAEVELTRGALQQALSQRRTQDPLGDTNKLPVLREAAPNRSMVVWRRSR